MAGTTGMQVILRIATMMSKVRRFSVTKNWAVVISILVAVPIIVSASMLDILEIPLPLKQNADGAQNSGSRKINVHDYASVKFKGSKQGVVWDAERISSGSHGALQVGGSEALFDRLDLPSSNIELNRELLLETERVAAPCKSESVVFGSYQPHVGNSGPVPVALKLVGSNELKPFLQLAISSENYVPYSFGHLLRRFLSQTDDSWNWRRTDSSYLVQRLVSVPVLVGTAVFVHSELPLERVNLRVGHNWYSSQIIGKDDLVRDESRGGYLLLLDNIMPKQNQQALSDSEVSRPAGKGLAKVEEVYLHFKLDSKNFHSEINKTKISFLRTSEYTAPKNSIRLFSGWEYASDDDLGIPKKFSDEGKHYLGQSKPPDNISIIKNIKIGVNVDQETRFNFESNVPVQSVVFHVKDNESNYRVLQFDVNNSLFKINGNSYAGSFAKFLEDPGAFNLLQHQRGIYVVESIEVYVDKNAPRIFSGGIVFHSSVFMDKLNGYTSTEVPIAKKFINPSSINQSYDLSGFRFKGNLDLRFIETHWSIPSDALACQIPKVRWVRTSRVNSFVPAFISNMQESHSRLFGVASLPLLKTINTIRILRSANFSMLPSHDSASIDYSPTPVSFIKVKTNRIALSAKGINVDSLLLDNMYVVHNYSNAEVSWDVNFTPAVNDRLLLKLGPGHEDKCQDTTAIISRSDGSIRSANLSSLCQLVFAEKGLTVNRIDLVFRKTSYSKASDIAFEYIVAFNDKSGVSYDDAFKAKVQMLPYSKSLLDAEEVLIKATGLNYFEIEIDNSHDNLVGVKSSRNFFELCEVTFKNPDTKSNGKDISVFYNFDSIIFADQLTNVFDSKGRARLRVEGCDFDSLGSNIFIFGNKWQSYQDQLGTFLKARLVPIFGHHLGSEIANTIRAPDFYNNNYILLPDIGKYTHTVLGGTDSDAFDFNFFTISPRALIDNSDESFHASGILIMVGILAISAFFIWNHLFDARPYRALTAALGKIRPAIGQFMSFLIYELKENRYSISLLSWSMIAGLGGVSLFFLGYMLDYSWLFNLGVRVEELTFLLLITFAVNFLSKTGVVRIVAGKFAIFREISPLLFTGIMLYVLSVLCSLVGAVLLAEYIFNSFFYYLCYFGYLRLYPKALVDKQSTL